jgi:uncharacterized protein involved in outer membrane biogenesis
MLKWLSRLAIVAVVIGTGLYLVRNVIARRAVELGVKAATGFPLEIQAVELSPFTSRLDVRGIQLRNPAGFEAPLFADVSQLYLDYRLPSLLTGANHLRQLTIRVEHLYLVKNSRGEANYRKFTGPTASAETQPATRYRLDQLRVQIGKVTLQDFSRGKPSERTYTLNLDRTYHDITDSTDISRLVLASLAGTIPLPELKTIAESVTRSGQQLFDTLKEALPR